jgi:uncharacterized protein
MKDLFSNCRENCGACCIAISISSVIPGMPQGKPAGVCCIHLTEDYLCKIYDDDLKPEVCSKFIFDEELCGKNREEAMKNLEAFERFISGK